MANKIYVLYPSGGGFSNDTVDYYGTSYSVAAANNRQAHVLAKNGVWPPTRLVRRASSRSISGARATWRTSWRLVATDSPYS